MSVALEAIEGIDSATVSLNEGVATITFAATHRVTVAQVRQVVRDNGFSPKATGVRLVGSVSESPEGVTLVLPGQDRPYALREHADFAGVMDRLGAAGLDHAVVIEGVVPESESGAEVRVLLLRRFSDAGVSN